ncbi:hypothetical protein HOD61_01440 [archaeon]|jgi:hypothetical protein|nr:hypothetical protein [archaeon]
MIKKGLIFGLIFTILLINCVSANSFILVSEDEIKDSVFLSETAIFKLSIHNNQDFQDTFRFSILDIGWEFETIPSTLTLDSGEIGEVEVLFSPDSDFNEGKYGITALIYSIADSNIFTEHIFDIRVIDFYDVLTTAVQIPTDINPQKQVVFNVDFNNNHDVNIENFEVILKSQFFEEKKTISLMPYETIKEEFVVEFSGAVSDGSYDLILEVYNGDELLIERDYDMLIGYYPEVNEQRSPESGFLIKSVTVVKSNYGTTTSHELYTKRFSFFERLFTSVSPEPTTTFRSGSAYTLQWDFDLAPGEYKEIVVTTNYRSLAIIFIILSGLFGYYYYYRKEDIAITKRVVNVRHSHEGISTINVLLVLKNKSGKLLKNLKVMDNLVNVADNPTNFGTIKPTIIRKGLGGVKMIWNIETLERGAEVIISYQAKCNVQVIGHLNIPLAVAKYIKRKRPIIVKSNKVKLFS